MGCGSSVEADERTRQPSEGHERTAPSSPAAVRRQSRQINNAPSGSALAKDDRYKDGQMQSINGGSQSIPQDGVLSQALLNDLKVKMSKESNSVARWVESIVEPSDTDNADLYDPRRRHMLSMESIASRQLQAMQQNQVLQQHQALREQASLSLTRDDMTPNNNTEGLQGKGTSLQASLSLALPDDGAASAAATPLIPVSHVMAQQCEGENTQVDKEKQEAPPSVPPMETQTVTKPESVPPLTPE